MERSERATPTPLSLTCGPKRTFNIGTAGNKRADKAAKAATRLDAGPGVFVSLTTVRRRIHLSVLGQWDVRWPRLKTGSALRYLEKPPPWTQLAPLYEFPSLPRHIISYIAQLRTGPSPLNDYRHKAGFVASPACEVCGAAVESRAHYLLECPAWEPHRQPLHAASRSGGRLGCIGPGAKIAGLGMESSRAGWTLKAP